MPVIAVDFGGSAPSGPPYLEGRDPVALLAQMLDTHLADGKTVRDVAWLAMAGEEEANIRLGFLGLRCDNTGVMLASPALFSRALPVIYESGGLYAFQAVGAILA